MTAGAGRPSGCVETMICDTVLAESLAKFVTRDFPADIRERTRLALLDHVGVAVVGSQRSHSRRAAEELLRTDPGPVPALGFNGRYSLSAATWLNGLVGSSAPNFDDVWHASLGHPGVGCLPVCLALGWQTAPSDDLLLTAILAGYEASMRVGAAIGRSAYEQGWHPRGGCNAFGAGLSADVLMGLVEPDEVLATLGHAANLTGGMVEASYFFDAWYVLSAEAAAVGLRAAQLASWGYTVSPTSISGRRGYGPVVSMHFDGKELLGGEEPLLSRSGQKLYPSSGATHSTIEATLELRAQEGFEAGDVSGIDVFTFHELVEHMSESRPRSLVQASMSVPFLVALAVVEADVTLDGLRRFDESTTELQRLCGLVRVVHADDLEAMTPKFLPSRVRVTLHDGRVFERTVQCARGHDSRALTSEEVVEKFMKITRGIMSASRQQEIVERVMGLGGGDGLRGLVQSVSDFS